MSAAADRTAELDERAAVEEDAPMETEGPEGLDPEAVERRAAALAQVIKFGDPVLKSRASEVSEFDEGLAAEAERMFSIMRDGMGVGLAATQLGVLRRMLVFQAGFDATPTALVNPEIEWSSDDLVSAEEGCLSLPGIVLDVERPLHIRASGFDTAGERTSIEASGLEARVLQHEIDHLDGILILQRAPRDQRRGAMRALRQGGSYAPERPEQEPSAAEGADGNGASARPSSAGG
jgi:peptide deformylase